MDHLSIQPYPLSSVSMRKFHFISPMLQCCVTLVVYVTEKVIFVPKKSGRDFIKLFHMKQSKVLLLVFSHEL